MDKGNISGRVAEFGSMIDKIEGLTKYQKITAHRNLAKSATIKTTKDKRLTMREKIIRDNPKASEHEIDRLYNEARKESYKNRGIRISQTLAQRREFLDEHLTLGQEKELIKMHKVGKLGFVGIDKVHKENMINEFINTNKENPNFVSARTEKMQRSKIPDSKRISRTKADNKRINEEKENAKNEIKSNIQIKKGKIVMSNI